MTAAARFSTVISAFGSNAGIEVPPAVLDELGAGKRPALRVTVGEYSWESSVGTMAGKHLISLSRAHREASGLSAGDEVTVDVQVLTGPRTLEVPEVLLAALDAAGRRGAFDALSFSARKEHARSVAEAKTDATRERRVQKVLDALEA